MCSRLLLASVASVASFSCVLLVTFLPAPASTLFPYTTLFRSIRHRPQSPGLSTAGDGGGRVGGGARGCVEFVRVMHLDDLDARSEEHTSELQSRGQLVCRLLLAINTTSWNSTATRRPRERPTQ